MFSDVNRHAVLPLHPSRGVKGAQGALYALEAPEGIAEKRAHTKAALADAAEQFVPPLRIYRQK